jgi:DNA-binding MarR family transcriptional regulator
MYFTVSNTFDETADWLEELPEPDAFSAEEFLAWRGLIRLRETVMREIDRRLRREGQVSLADYGVLITLVTAPGFRLRMSELGSRRLLTPSGITRVVIRLEQQGLVRREPDPADGRAAFAALTRTGLEALRRAQVVHHAAVRELYLGPLTPQELKQLTRLFEKAMPGVVSASDWPPAASPAHRRA